MFYIVLNFKELVISPQPDVRVSWDLNQNVAFKMDMWIKLKFANCRHVTHSPWPCHICRGWLMVLLMNRSDASIHELKLNEFNSGSKMIFFPLQKVYFFFVFVFVLVVQLKYAWLTLKSYNWSPPSQMQIPTLDV